MRKHIVTSYEYSYCYGASKAKLFLVLGRAEGGASEEVLNKHESPTDCLSYLRYIAPP